MKKINAFLMLMTVTTAAFAGEGRVDLASIRQESSLKIQTMDITPAVTEQCEYYEVRGNNEKELKRQLAKNGCTAKDGKKYDSITRWHVTWDYGYNRGPNSCSADAFTSTVNIVSRYPKWVRIGGVVPQPLDDAWEAYMKNLTTHEKGHCDMVVEAAAELSRAVAELQPAPSCAILDRQVRAICKKRIDKLNSDTEEYDAATVHGAKQGAIFP